jgi:ATP-dependent RNA/DNA helicase IGHMBP2
LPQIHQKISELLTENSITGILIPVWLLDIVFTFNLLHYTLMSEKDTREELQELLELLKVEQEEDRKLYESKMLNASIPERRAQGLTWYPIVVKESYYGVGDRLILEIERPSFKEIPHQFQSGRVAAVFSNNQEEEPDTKLAGVVTAVRPDNIKLTLFVDELPDWFDRGKLGLDLLFDETSYKEMENTLQRVIKARHNRLAQLREVLLGKEEADFREKKTLSLDPALNASQKKAIENVVFAKDVAIIHGPPGTGKTTTLVEAIRQVLAEEEQVLVCAPSNTAVDLLTEKLHEKGVKVVRLGHPSRVSETLLAHTLDVQISSHKDFKQIKELKKRAIEYRNMALKYKRNFGREERNQRRIILDESRKLQQEAEAIENYITQDILSRARVFTCTLVGAASYLLKDREFDTVFIDEAAQALEPASWIPITKGKRVIFAGDHCQLPPTVKSQEAAKGGLSVTLFEKCIQRQKADVMLDTQYRMNEQIMKFSSTQFYQDKLMAHASVKDQLLTGDAAFTAPVEFVDTAGCGFEEKVEEETSSTLNPEEAQLLFKHFTTLVETIGQQVMIDDKIKIALISPYKAQVNFLKELLVAAELDECFKKQVSINTVDGFQGQEREIVYISLVRSNSKGEIGFLSDIRRMNVAMTRAKKKLVVVGESGTLAGHSFYRAFLEYTESIGAYKTAWEYMY